ncbi:hypothetical protein CFC21_007251 [Triticum aestivum]|uniref:Aminotransferase-like plant mobile domain-containing protein n=3 Tax=Triticum TaxID=4564 RepID=A0A9R0QYV7_TRITD|nr:hypothetical protein CFC21_007251 [Triticum aestivum]VAH18699.1 unnamed protein product [Triticum turgidum subsp. durum]
MAGGEQLLVQESAVPVISSDADLSTPTVRLAHFLHPRAGAGQRPPLPSPPRNAGPILADGIQVEFKGWAEAPNLWTRWVAKLRPRCEPLWRKLGIQDAVLATTCRVRRDERTMLQLAAIWSAETNTFVFPWGEATVTLEDVAVLGGLPLLGRPVRAPLKGALREDVEALEGVRRALYRSDSQRPDHSAWAMPFLEPPAGEGPAAGDGGATGLLEHGAFLAMWLSLFVLPAPPFDVVRAEVLPVAARLARGGCVALGPAALASIYSDLSALNRYINLDKRYQPFVGWAPLHILQLWVLARFPELRPEMATTLDPVARHQPWAARWHEAHKVIDPINLHRVFMLPMEFEWRPYGSFTFAPSPKKSCSWVHGRDMARSLQLLSFAQCLRACELVGMRCIEQYNPHRVARQLGFDQDVPGSVARVNSDWKIAWGTYFMEPSNFAFIVPQYMMAVTFEYTRWWRPYASGCDTAIDNNVNSKEFPVLVSPRDKNMEVLHDDNSGKKQHVLPGMSRPDTFEVFFSRLNTFEVSQTDIPLVEKLNGLDTIQGTLEHLAEVAGSAQIADNSTLRCVRKGTETKNVKQASPDVFAKQNSSSEHGATVGHVHLFKRAVSTTNRKTIGATVGHVQPSLEDIVVMLDEEFDESVGKEHEVGATVGHVQPSLEDVIVISDEEFDESVGKEHEVGAMPREGNEKANEDASALNQQSDTLMEDCIVANRKSSGNNKMYSSNQVDANPELVKRVISTKTLYYLRPIGPVKDAQERDATGTNTDQGADLPRREVGTREMIEEASAAREAEKVVLQKVIDSLKEEIAAAQALGDLRDGSPSKT